MYGMNVFPSQSMGAQGYGSLAQFASNPQDIRNQIQQDLQGYNQGFNQGFNQGYNQGFNQGIPYNNTLGVTTGGAGMGGSTLAQFGTHPQGIQQQIQQDLQSARAYHAQWAAQNGVNPQAVQASTYGSPMNGYTQQGVVPQNYAMNFAGPNPQYANYGAGVGASTLAQYGSNPQQIRQQLQQGQNGPQGYGYGMSGIVNQQSALGMNPQGSTLSQFGTYPQMVQNQIRQDMGQSYQ
ncbi:hypothetical protein D2Q93_16210 [Alicyclobacillaceae bacterium I2511]|nr:hypothetical protein D2Q93_16210 [Alicyclobacillaceae bacterium I2511]